MTNLIDGILLSTTQKVLKGGDGYGIEEALLDHWEKNPNKAVAGLSLNLYSAHSKRDKN